jgi:hypothetical protein
MAPGRNQSLKFQLRWRGPFKVIKRLSDLTYLIRLKSHKEAVVSVNGLNLCRSVTAGQNLSRPLTRRSDNCSSSENEPEAQNCADKESDEERIPPRSQKISPPLPAMNDNRPYDDHSEN